MFYICLSRGLHGAILGCSIGGGTGQGFDAVARASAMGAGSKVQAQTMVGERDQLYERGRELALCSLSIRCYRPAGDACRTHRP